MYSKNSDQLGPLRGEHLAVASDLGHCARERRQHEQAEQKRGDDGRGADSRAVPSLAALDNERDDAEQDADDDHRLQTYDAPDDKASGGHAALPAAVVCVADDKARENKEKVDGEVAVVETLVDGRCGESLEDVIPDDKQCGDAAQAVEYLVALSGCCRRRGHKNM